MENGIRSRQKTVRLVIGALGITLAVIFGLIAVEFMPDEFGDSKAAQLANHDTVLISRSNTKKKAEISEIN